jgi:hypothetical protein
MKTLLAFAVLTICWTWLIACRIYRCAILAWFDRQPEWWKLAAFLSAIVVIALLGWWIAKKQGGAL